MVAVIAAGAHFVDGGVGSEGGGGLRASQKKYSSSSGWVKFQNNFLYSGNIFQ